MKKYEIHSIQDVGTILDHVHDRRFDIGRIVFDRDKHFITIPTTVLGEERLVGKLLFLKKWNLRVYAADLMIYNVIDYELIDRAKVGSGDINTITLEDDILVIKGGLPVTIRVRISGLHLELSITDRIVHQESYLLFRIRDYIDRSE